MRPPEMARKALRLLLPLALVLASCTSGGGETGQGSAARAEPLGPGDACSLDVECTGLASDGPVRSLRCEPRRKICICISDDACPLSQACDPFTGRCVAHPPGCRVDRDCEADQWCDRARRACRPRRSFCEPCDSDLACADGGRCLPGPDGASFCGKSCDGDFDCPWPDSHCGSDGQCRPQISCAASAPCIPDLPTSCTLDADCGEGFRCAADGRSCVPIVSGCRPGSSCDPGTRSCRTLCDDDSICGSGAFCDRTGHCAPVPACSVDADCERPLICRVEPGATSGACIRGCADEGDCPIGSRCESRDGRTVCVAGCRTNADCPPWQICSAAGACAGPTVDGATVCQINAVCGSCEVCSENRCTPARSLQAPYCMSCGSDSECGSGGLCDPATGRCAPACPSTGCPRGFSCQPVRDAQTGSSRSVCFPNDNFCDTECT